MRVTLRARRVLLATKLIASRRKDADADVRELAKRTSTSAATTDALEALIYRYYADRNALELNHRVVLRCRPRSGRSPKQPSALSRHR